MASLSLPLPSYLDHPGPLPIAHRGGTVCGPENSMRSFEHAVGLGYRYLETDLQVTADGVLLAFHDRTLQRVCGVPGLIARMPYERVAAARVAGAEPIPRLEDVLTAWPDVRFNVDVKTWATVGPLREVLRRTRSWDRVCVASFSDLRLARVRAAFDPRVCTALGPVAIARLWLAARYRLLHRLARAGVPCVQAPVAIGSVPVVTAPFVATAHALGLHVHVWTVNREAEMERLLDLGVDGIMSDQTELLREVLVRRGQWFPG